MKKQKSNLLKFENKVLFVFRDKKSRQLNYTGDIMDTTTTVTTTHPTTSLAGGRPF